MDAATADLLDEVAALFDELLGAGVVGVYPQGSVAWGDYVPESSDVDVLVVTAGPIGDNFDRAAERLLLLARASAPLAGLEVVVVTADHAARPRNPPAVEMEFAAFRDRAWEPELTGTGPAGDATPLLAQAIVLATGSRHSGQAPASVFGPIPRRWILGACADELGYWATRSNVTDHPVPVRTAVLNACRARRYAIDGDLGSKRQGGEWALRRGDAPHPDAIRSALALQAGKTAELPTEAAIQELLAQAAAVVADARAG